MAVVALALAAAVACGTLTPAVERMILTVDPLLVRAVVANESSFDPRAVSSSGARGLMQLEPATARSVAVCDSFDPAQNIVGGARYLKAMLVRYHGNVRSAISAYNAGPGAVDRYHGVPPFRETRRYVASVLASFASYTRYSVSAPSVFPAPAGSAPKPVQRIKKQPRPAFGFGVNDPDNIGLPKF